MAQQGEVLVVRRYWREPVHQAVVQVDDRYVSAGDPPEGWEPGEPGWPPDGAIEIPGHPGWWFPVVTHTPPPGSTILTEAEYFAAVTLARTAEQQTVEQSWAVARAGAQADLAAMLGMGWPIEMVLRMLGTRVSLLTAEDLPELPPGLPDIPGLPGVLGGES